MTFRLPRSVLPGLALVTLAARAAAPDAPLPAPQTIAQQIDALLKRRLKPEPLPLDLPNPFVMSAKESKDSIVLSSAPAAALAPGETPETKPAGNAEVLADAIAHLRFGGIIRIKDQVQVVINDLPRKEGDTFKLTLNNASIFLRVQRISPADVVLRYNDIEATVRF